MFTLVLKTAAKILHFSLRYHYPRFFLIFFYALRFHFNSFLSIPQMGQESLILILGGEDGVCEVTIYVAPFVKTSVIEHLQFVCYDERYDIISEALLKHNEQ